MSTNAYNILLFDDRPQIRIFLQETFIKHSFNVYSCKNVFEADVAWEKYQTIIDAIILDMMMPSRGLPFESKGVIDGEMNTGWVWLWHHLNPENLDKHPAADKCVIIFSGYLDAFKTYLQSIDPESKEKKFADNVKKIGKDEPNHLMKMIEYLEENRRQKQMK